jgi:hypothetical protein
MTASSELAMFWAFLGVASLLYGASELARKLKDSYITNNNKGDVEDA